MISGVPAVLLKHNGQGILQKYRALHLGPRDCQADLVVRGIPDPAVDLFLRAEIAERLREITGCEHFGRQDAVLRGLYGKIIGNIRFILSPRPENSRIFPIRLTDTLQIHLVGKAVFAVNMKTGSGRRCNALHRGGNSLPQNLLLGHTVAVRVCAAEAIVCKPPRAVFRLGFMNRAVAHWLHLLFRSARLARDEEHDNHHQTEKH